MIENQCCNQACRGYWDHGCFCCHVEEHFCGVPNTSLSPLPTPENYPSNPTVSLPFHAVIRNNRLMFRMYDLLDSAAKALKANGYGTNYDKLMNQIEELLDGIDDEE